MRQGSFKWVTKPIPLCLLIVLLFFGRIHSFAQADDPDLQLDPITIRQGPSFSDGTQFTTDTSPLENPFISASETEFARIIQQERFNQLSQQIARNQVEQQTALAQFNEAQLQQQNKFSQLEQQILQSQVEHEIALSESQFHRLELWEELVAKETVQAQSFLSLERELIEGLELMVATAFLMNPADPFVKVLDGADVYLKASNLIDPRDDISTSVIARESNGIISEFAVQEHSSQTPSDHSSDALLAWNLADLLRKPDRIEIAEGIFWLAEQAQKAQTGIYQSTPLYQQPTFTQLGQYHLQELGIINSLPEQPIDLSGYNQYPETGEPQPQEFPTYEENQTSLQPEQPTEPFDYSIYDQPPEPYAPEYNFSDYVENEINYSLLEQPTEPIDYSIYDQPPEPYVPEYNFSDYVD